MNTLHLRYVVEVERTKSITQAADNLYMAQPNLSKAIKELEDSIGITIFNRTSKGVEPTPKGREFLQYAKNILAQVAKMEMLQLPEDGDCQTFSVCIQRGSYIASSFTGFVQELDTSRGISVSFKEAELAEVISCVTDGISNLGIIRYQTEYEKYFANYLSERSLIGSPVWEHEYIIVMSKEHPLATKKKLEMDELEEYIEITHGGNVTPVMPAEGSPFSEMMRQRGLANGNKRISVNERSSRFDMLSHMPKAYMWASPVPQEQLDRYSLVQRLCSGENRMYRDILIYQKDYRFTGLDKKFIDKLYMAKNEVAFNKYY